MITLLDLCVSSLRRGHANLLCIVPILTDDPRRESNRKGKDKSKPLPKVRNNVIAIQKGIAVRSGCLSGAEGLLERPITRIEQVR
jgi:hypothetical protein